MRASAKTKSSPSSDERVAEGGADNNSTRMKMMRNSIASSETPSLIIGINASKDKPVMCNSVASSEKPSLATGINAEGKPVKATLRKQFQPSATNPLLIGIRGNWYDVTSFVPHHPGGDILLDFAGQDATPQFIAYHDEKMVLKSRKPVGRYDYKAADKMDEDWLKLNDKYEKLGYFKTPLPFVLSRFAILLGFLTASLTCVCSYLQSPNLLVLITGSVFLAGVWQQSGKNRNLVCSSHEQYHLTATPFQQVSSCTIPCTTTYFTLARLTKAWVGFSATSF
jgi:hypothetical protein